MTTTTQSRPEPQPDNLLGICAAIGTDFGVNPLWLRVALGAGILWNPAVVLATYLGLGVVVLATRLLFPDRKPAAADGGAAAPLPQVANEDVPGLALAA